MELLLQHGDHSRNGQGFLQEVDAHSSWYSGRWYV